MRFVEWFRPGIHIKRWILLGILGIACISFGLSFMIREIYLNVVEVVLAILMSISGSVFIYFSIKYYVNTFFNAIANSSFKISLDSNKLSNLMYEKRILIKGPKIVAIGGGTGLSTMLRGLKLYSSNITAVVTVADDGGGSGMLRQELGILPPGDIRNCILALADTEPIMEKLLQYRFEDGMLKGQSFGNLFLAAMDGISDNFEEAVRKMSDVLAVTGKVLPVTLDNIKLNAELEDGFIICGESNINKHDIIHSGKINRVFLDTGEAKALTEVLEDINEADMLILGPGSLYTSIIPNLLIKGVCEAFKKSKAPKVYVCNVMTQPNETDDYTAMDHIRAIEKHSYKGILDYCIVNTADISEELKVKYKIEGAELVRVDQDQISKEGIKVIESELVSIKNNFIRHNSKKLAEIVIELVANTVLAKDKKRSIDYYYIKDRLKRLGSG